RSDSHDSQNSAEATLVVLASARAPGLQHRQSALRRAITEEMIHAQIYLCLDRRRHARGWRGTGQAASTDAGRAGGGGGKESGSTGAACKGKSRAGARAGPRREALSEGERGSERLESRRAAFRRKSA